MRLSSSSLLLSGTANAAASTIAHGPVTPAHILSLFRGILREHRRLPAQMRGLGDRYVRNEFRLHRNAKPDQVVAFYAEWNRYLNHMRYQRGAGGDFGVEMSDAQRAQLNKDQVDKLKKLRR